MTKLIVRFTKHFTSGSLKGLTYDETVKAIDLDDANSWIRFCHSHSEIPVKAIGGGDYTVSMARIETVEGLCDCGEPKDHTYHESCIPF